MARINQYHPKTISHPGETLKEKLGELNMGAKEFAIRTGKPEKTITAILSGTSSITSDMAIKFESVLKIPARFWLRRQVAYDERKARLKRRKTYLKEGDIWSKSMPYKEMMELNWIPYSPKKEERVEYLLDFFGIGAYSAWTDYYHKQELKRQFNICLKHTKSDYTTSVWLRQGEIQASQINAPLFDKKKLKENLKAIKRIMLTGENIFFQKIQHLCLEAGIKIVVTPSLSQSTILGATRWLDGTPLLQFTIQQKESKTFGFAFFHAVGHILLHGTKFISLENVDYQDKNELKEKEADDFAAMCIYGRKGNQVQVDLKKSA